MSGITDPTEEYFKDGLWGWDGSRWRKLNLLFGYNRPYNDLKGNPDVPAGASDLAGSTVPEDEVWVVCGMAMYVVSASCSLVRFGFWNGNTRVFCKEVQAPASERIYDFQGTLILAAGYYILIRMYNMTAGDDAILYGWGYKMETA